ncbi:MAG TPA: hypothetical protein PL009_05115 [Flavipsychrobacter sp.]|nr:hypothetical protein [Flavipsychrobacter sp.]
MKMNMEHLNMRNLRGNGMSEEQRRILMISGIVIGTAALLTYPAILLYRHFRNQQSEMNQQQEENTTKSFAPSYRGKHKPHHRKAESNGHIPEAQS